MAKSVAVFNWTDKEIELLLETVKSFKVENDAEGIDWESCRTKYEKIMNIFLEIYQKNKDDEENYPRAKSLELLNRTRITSKLKSIRSSYKKAVDICFDCATILIF